MKKRVITAIVLAPIVLGASILNSPYPIFCIVLLVATLGFWELRTLLKEKKSLPVVTLFGLAVPFYGTEIQSNRDPLQVIPWAVLFWAAGVFFAWLACRRKRTSGAELDMAGLWISMPLACLLMLHKLANPEVPAGLVRDHAFYTIKNSYILLVLIPLWVGDIGALFVGKKFGKRLLWPKISPKKTVAGAIANLVLSIGAALALLPIIQTPETLASSHRMVYVHLACGIVVGVAGQLGDLFESYLKRLSGVKDSGSLLPGHGGVLDRIDSLLFAAPIVSIILEFWFRA